LSIEFTKSEYYIYRTVLIDYIFDGTVTFIVITISNKYINQ